MNDYRIKAAVLVPVYRNLINELILVLVRRTAGDIHGGQIAFPGGKKAPNDKSLEVTAIRETEEEIGLNMANIHILEQLPNVFTQTSKFDITPFLARIMRPKKWKIDEREIAEIIEIPVKELLKPEIQGEEIKNFPTWPAPRMVPFYRIGPYQLWGATYRILNPIVERLLNRDWQI